MAAPRFSDLDVERVRANLSAVGARIEAAAARAGRDAAGVELLAAGKYVPDDQLSRLADAGIRLVGENRAQDLERRALAFGDRLTFDFIGVLQSRKVRTVLRHARLIHSVASDSALQRLRRHADPGTEVLVQVNVAGEASKSGIAPDELEAFIARCPVHVAGVMTMPPETGDPQSSRPHFAATRELAQRHGLERLSMGTSQDFEVAVEEGATIVRIGTILYS